MPTPEADVAEAAGTRIGGDFVYHFLEFSEKVFEVFDNMWKIRRERCFVRYARKHRPIELKKKCHNITICLGNEKMTDILTFIDFLDRGKKCMGDLWV